MLVARQFTPRAVRQIEEHLRLLVNELIDGFIAEGSCEAIESLASPLPAIVIGDKLGFPRELWPKLREWSEITMYESGQNPPDGSPSPFSERSTNAIMEFAGTVMGLIHDIPTVGDLVSRIVDEAQDIITGRLAGMVTVDARA
jgi:cytochrome P450 family 142 subfamily A polypeptide 1